MSRCCSLIVHQGPSKTKVSQVIRGRALATEEGPADQRVLTWLKKNLREEQLFGQQTCCLWPRLGQRDVCQEISIWLFHFHNILHSFPLSCHFTWVFISYCSTNQISLAMKVIFTTLCLTNLQICNLIKPLMTMPTRQAGRDNRRVCGAIKGLFADKTRQNAICALLKGEKLMRKWSLLQSEWDLVITLKTVTL